MLVEASGFSEVSSSAYVTTHVFVAKQAVRDYHRGHDAGGLGSTRCD